MDNTILLCCSCNKTTTGGHYCKICKKPCHAIELCSVSCGEEGYGTKVICSDCFIDVEVVEDSSEEENEDVSKKAYCKEAKKRRVYTINEKIEILDFSRKTSIHEASRKFKLGRSTIQGWKKNEISFQNM